jgi:hypothetical protein
MRVLHHKLLGEVKFTEACAKMEKTNPDKTSVFVEYEDDIREVTRNLIIEYYQIIIRTTDPSGNIIKEDIIETEMDDQLIWKQSHYSHPTIINSGDELNIKFGTNNTPEEHIQFHNKIVEKVKLSKEDNKTEMLYVENLDKKYQSTWEFSWRKIQT